MHSAAVLGETADASRLRRPSAFPGWVAAAALLLALTAAPAALGQEAAPPPNPAKDFTESAKAFPLSVVAIVKIVAAFVLFYVWVLVGDWVNRDSQIHELNFKKWNPIAYAPFALLGIVLLFVPLGMLIKLPILAVALLATSIPYVLVHNKSVERHETVLTGAWWRFFFANLLSKVGVKVSTERKADYEKGAAVELLALGAEDVNENNANLLTARQSPGYLLLKDLVVEMHNRRTERVRLDYTQQDVKVRHEIDGMWHPGEAQEREPADVMLAVMKTLANCDAKERKKPQKGLYGAKYEGHSYTFVLESQGVKTGERVVVTMRGREEQTFDSLTDMGMRESLAEKWMELIAQDRGLLIISTMPGGGLTTVVDVSLNETDRLMRDFVAIEDKQHPEKEVQNIGVNFYDSKEGQTPDVLLPDLVRTYPGVYICRDFVNAETANVLCGEVLDDRLVVTTVQGREAAEAPIRLMQLKLKARDFSAAVSAVLYQRLVRKLCCECKVGYTPPPDVLKKLGIPAGTVEKLYRPPKPEEIEKPCKACQGLGYLGRTGIFELLVITDPMRQVLEKSPKVELLKKAARLDHQRSLQEEGILLVAKGVTSLPELMRVLKA
ncbi:MAG: ATPase, T2SS/T4P/T4SS family [Planctomycetota bacterium]